MFLQNKNIVLGVTGGIAAYKSPQLVRRLKEQGANVRVVMTSGAKAFITPLTLQAVSGYPVSDSLLDPAAEAAMGHIELAKWADLIIIAPASANTLARLAHGLADDLLATIVLASDAPLAIAPAMNQQMWHAKATQDNLAILQARGVVVMGPGSGEQACGDIGYGRMLEPDELASLILGLMQEHAQHLELAGQHWVITAGPTREAIDPVRYISNHSSGKMGYAIAQAAQQAGANVTIISGPVNIAVPEHCHCIQVNSANEMHQQALQLAKDADVFIACAAVADYRVAEIQSQKIKKSADKMTIELVKNPDIVADVAALKSKPFTVGFAAETQQVEQYAKLKLARKNLDMICANNVASDKQGFNSDNNALHLYWDEGEIELPLTSKSLLAKQLVQKIDQRRQSSKPKH